MKRIIQDTITTCSALGLLIVLVLSVVIIGVKIIEIENPISVMSEGLNCSEIIVQPGDTLWTIAQAQVPNQDPRDVVGSIKKLNQLQSAYIYPGQTLFVALEQNAPPIKLVKKR